MGVSRSAFGQHRVIPDRWKGMSENQLINIRAEQEQQRLENIKKNETMKARDLQWSRQKNSQAKAAILREREQIRQIKTGRKELDNENELLANQQKNMRQNFDKDIYINVPNERYYSQFN